MAFLMPTPVLGAHTLPISRTSLSHRVIRARRTRPVLKCTLGEKFGHLRGRDIPSVADTVSNFTKQFGRPVPIVYRGIVNELITTTHLAVVCAMWRYDAIFALGFEHIFSTFLQYYPDVEEQSFLRSCIAQALSIDAKATRLDADAVTQWAEGKKPADVFAAVKDVEQGGCAVEALRAVQNASKYEWYYSRLYGIGIIALMQLVGEDIDGAAAERWAEELGMEKTKFTSEMGAYVSNMERLKMAEQIFAEAAAREAKKTAERLAKRAEAAAKKLEELEAKGPGGTEKENTVTAGAATAKATGDETSA